MSSLVIVPTRELCNQVVKMAKAVSKKVKIAKAVGGENREEQVERFESRRVDLCVGTPGRVKDLMSMPVCANFLTRTGVLILDEVDVLCSKNFLDDLNVVMEQLKGRGLWGFSATAGKGVKEVVGEGAVFLKCVSEDSGEGKGKEERAKATETKSKETENKSKAMEIKSPAKSDVSEKSEGSDEDVTAPTAGENDKAAAPELTLPTLPPHITQILHVTSSHKRQKKLLHILPKILDPSGQRRKPQCMVFFGTIKELKEVGRFLDKKREEVSLPPHAPLHGQIPQDVRTKTLNNFRAGKFQLLLCTDVAGRGVDIKGLKYCVLYDFPPSLETWVHRSGRVGRGGNGKKNVEGVVYSFFERKWRMLAKDVKIMLEGAGQWIDPNLEEIVGGKGKKDKKKKKKEKKEEKKK